MQDQKSYSIILDKEKIDKRADIPDCLGISKERTSQLLQDLHADYVSLEGSFSVLELFRLAATHCDNDNELALMIFSATVTVGFALSGRSVLPAFMKPINDQYLQAAIIEAREQANAVPVTPGTYPLDPKGPRTYNASFDMNRSPTIPGAMGIDEARVEPMIRHLDACMEKSECCGMDMLHEVVKIARTDAEFAFLTFQLGAKYEQHHPTVKRGAGLMGLLNALDSLPFQGGKTMPFPGTKGEA